MTDSHTRLHAHRHGMVGRTLRTAFALTLGILAVELVGGIVSHSLALLSDAGHVFTDVIALGLAWFAAGQTERPANERKTFGYHRIGVLAALVNAVTLIAVVAVIAVEAVLRLRQPEAVTPWVMFVAAGVGIAANVYIAYGLRREGGENLNARAALLHVVGDIGASAAVIASGVVILLTGWYPADAVLSLVIAALIARSAWAVLRETLDILMEASPRGLDTAQLARDIEQAPGVSGVHDLHVWTLAGGVSALSAHVRVPDRRVSDCDALLGEITRMLAVKYAIGHTTIQFECADCGHGDLYCSMSPESSHVHPADTADTAAR
jgi:cobalt-zinc-cadmium efflux system protein